jgi:glyoxylase-like metal-dependent hydrolase (beta-lactamase superfamily II)
VAAVGGCIHTLEIPTPFRVGPVNCYLIEGPPLGLVDTGPNWPESLDALERQLLDLGHRLDRLELILLTHQHYDHVGLARELKRRSGAEIVAHPILAEFLADVDSAMDADDAYADGVMALYGVDPAVARDLRNLSRSFRRFGASVEVDHILREGEVIRFTNLELAFELRPGHSPSDTVFYSGRERMALVGDHLLAAISSNPILHRPLDEPADVRHRRRPLMAYLDSLRRTAADNPSVVLPGHGPPINNARDLIAERLRHHDSRKKAILRIVQQRPRTAHEIGTQLWPNLRPDEVYLALSEVLGHLDILLVEGSVVERQRGGVVEFVDS